MTNTNAAKHTPGPWKAGSKSVSAPETEDRLPLDVRLFGGNADDHRANARLIAASPDMFSALAGLLEIEEERITSGLFTPNAEGMKRIEAARAAIKKATHD